MSTQNWYISTNGSSWQTCAAAGIVRPQLKLCANGIDTLTFSIAGDMLGSTYSYMSTIYLALGTTTGGNTTYAIKFIGTIITIPRQGQGVQEFIQLVAAGGWWWLDQITYCHTWTFWDTVNNVTQSVQLPRVILGQDDTGAQRNSGPEIIAAIDYAIARGAPIARNAIASLAPLPYSEHTNISVGDAIRQALRLQPDVVCWFDYSSGTPTFNCVAAGSLSAANVALTACTGLNMTPRYDLQLPGITLFYEITTTVNGAIFRGCVVDAQGTTSDPRAVSAIYDLQGPTYDIQTQSIVTHDYPTINAAFVQTLVPWLASCTGVTLNSTKVNGVTSSTPSHARYMLPGDGTIQSWMTTMTSPIHSAQDRWTFNVSYTDADGNELTKDIDVTLLSTDATTQTYQLATCTNVGDNQPITGANGVAAKLYASWSRLPWDGQFTLLQQEPTLANAPGTLVNITGGLSAWTSMAAIVQEIAVDLDAGVSTVRTGTSGRLSADQLVALWRGLHFYRYPTHLAARVSASTPTSVSPGTAAAPATVIADGAPGTFDVFKVNGINVGVVDPATAVDTLGANSLGAEAADSNTWTAGATNGLAVWIETRARYYHAGDQKWYAYARKFTYTANGNLYSVSAETRIEVEAPTTIP